MKIAVVATEFPLLSETFVLNQVTGLLELGYEVDVHARFRGRTTDPLLSDGGLEDRIRSWRMPWSYYLRLLRVPRALSRHTARERRTLLRAINALRFGPEGLSLKLFYASRPFLRRSYDVVHCHFGPNGNRVAQMKELGIVRAPLMTTFHGVDLRLAEKKGSGVYRHLQRHGDLFVAISDYSRRRLEEMGFDPSRIVEHQMGIDLDRFPFRGGRPDPPSEDRPARVLSVGRLEPEKGHDVGLRALHRLLRREPGLPIKYVIVGAGRLGPELIRLAKRLGLSEHVRFMGALNREDVVRELGKADVFLLSSRAEVLPMVLMEAQATGLPVIATDVGAVAELVEDGVTGYLVPPDEPSMIADRLRKLLVERGRYPEMARRGREIVEERHDIRMLNRRLAHLLESLAKGAGPPQKGTGRR